MQLKMCQKEEMQLAKKKYREVVEVRTKMFSRLPRRFHRQVSSHPYFITYTESLREVRNIFFLLFFNFF